MQIIPPFLFVRNLTPCLVDVAQYVLHNLRKVRRDFERGLDALLAEPLSVSPTGLTIPSNSVGSGALGYYIIYQV